MRRLFERACGRVAWLCGAARRPTLSVVNFVAILFVGILLTQMLAQQETTDQRIRANQNFIACRLIETKHNVERYVISEDNDESDRQDNDPTEVDSAAELIRDFEAGKRALRGRVGEPCPERLRPLPAWRRPGHPMPLDVVWNGRR